MKIDLGELKTGFRGWSITGGEQYYWNLGLGVAVLAIVFGAHRLTKRDGSESLHDIFDAVNPNRKKLWYRILNNFVAPCSQPWRSWSSGP